MAYVSRVRWNGLHPVLHSRNAFTRNYGAGAFDNLPDDPRQRASNAFSVLAKKDKSWLRFQHMVDLAVEHQHNNPTIRSVVDVGTDHGLLAGGLATTGRFEKVLGVDASPKALNSGGFDLLRRIRTVACNNQRVGDTEWLTANALGPLEFRLSDGLKLVQPGEADAVCIAGMGVNVMATILQATTDQGIQEVDRLGCQQLILQPATSRPRHLMQLYRTLQESRWKLQDERMEYLSHRWYISSSFIRAPGGKDSSHVHSDATTWDFPTSKLALRSINDSMKRITIDYYVHHLDWIRQEESSSQNRISPTDDTQWRDWAISILLDDKRQK